jgi:phage terminase large subunit-like protein
MATKKKQTKAIDTGIIQQIVNDREVRLAVTYESHFLFFHTYLGHYVKYPTADFQKEMFSITEDSSGKLAVIVAFRGSGKSTIVTFSYPIWAVIGEQQKKFVVIISQTQQQTKIHLDNIKRELESNRLLKREMGPFEEDGQWGSTSLVLPKFNARILAISRGQSIRGMRHGENRPDLIILDDVEDLDSVDKKESRDKTYNWLMGEIIPAGDKNTKVIAIGNLLHEDSLLMRLRKNIKNEKSKGVYRAYPLIDDFGKTIWPGKFRSETDIEEAKQSIGSNEVAWQREFMLRIIPDDGQVIHPDWIQYYDKLPATKPSYIIIGVDLAISKENRAHHTAIVSAFIYGFGENCRAYILPNPVNEKLDFPQTTKTIKDIYDTIDPTSSRIVCVEDVAYQASAYQQLKEMGVRAEGIKLYGQDKRARLALTTNYICQGKILFPIHGAEDLINQLVNFGVEKYDDLADAFSLLTYKVISRNKIGSSFGVLITER